jgi:predicted nucleotidyltransferase
VNGSLKNRPRVKPPVASGHGSPNGPRKLGSKSQASGHVTVRPVWDGTRLIAPTAIQTFCNGIAREFRPERIILFGSYAYGTPTPDSDVDLLVIMPYRGRPAQQAFRIRSRFDTPFAMDLIVRNPMTSPHACAKATCS